MRDTDQNAAEPTTPPPVADTTSTDPDRLPLHQRLRRDWGEWFKTNWPWFALALVLAIAGWLLVKPAPPKTIVIATGRGDGSYHWFAKRYAETFKASGVTLEVRETAGTVENYRLLADPNSGVSVAIVQGGACPPDLGVELHAIASLYLEPVWVFYRGQELARFSDLAGKRIAVGPDGSGTREIAMRLLAANGVAASAAPATPTAAPTSQPVRSDSPATMPIAPVELRAQAGQSAVDALRAGEVDAIVLVIAPSSPIVQRLLREEGPDGIRLLNFERHEAYARIFPFVSDVKLPRGVVDLKGDLPSRDVFLVAPAANLVAREDLHPALVPLLAKAASLAHDRGDLLSAPGTFPSARFVEFPLDPAARDYFQSGPPFLQRYLPFWIAALVDRMKVLLLPLLTLVIPLVRIAPPLYVWRIRSRIYRWYRVLRDADQKLRSPPNSSTDHAQFERELATLVQMEKEIGEVKVPLAYMEEFYNLRLHADFVRRRIEERLGGQRRAQTEQLVVVPVSQ